MMINIYRNHDYRTLDIQVVIGRTKSYVRTTQGLQRDILEAMIANAAEVMGGDGLKAIVDFNIKYQSMRALSLELRKRLASVKVRDFVQQYEDIDDIPAAVAKFMELERYLICKGVLTHQEIHWLDWFLRRHKLTGEL